MSGSTDRLKATKFADLYAAYLAKVERKGFSQADLDEVLTWVTGLKSAELADAATSDVALEDFIAGFEPPQATEEITGVICGVRVEEITDPFMHRVRQLDKVVDELTRGKKKESILRS